MVLLYHMMNWCRDGMKLMQQTIICYYTHIPYCLLALKRYSQSAHLVWNLLQGWVWYRGHYMWSKWLAFHTHTLTLVFSRVWIALWPKGSVCYFKHRWATKRLYSHLNIHFRLELCTHMYINIDATTTMVIMKAAAVPTTAPIAMPSMAFPLSLKSVWEGVV